MSGLAGMLGDQLARPAGWRGRIAAAAMRLVNRRSTRLAIDALDIDRGHMVLDLGCGGGDAVAELTRRAGTRQVIGVDHSPMMIATAQRRFPKSRFHLARFDALPMPTASVDRVLATNVAYFWHDDTSVMAEIKRVLRPGGKVVVYVTEPAFLDKAGLGRTGTHRLFNASALAKMMGPGSQVWSINAGFGARGWLAVLAI